jgi:pyrophosphatase PpaX
MNNYNLILYDLDGTIWDSVPLIVRCFKYAYMEVFGHCDRSDEDLKSYIGRSLGETFAMHDKQTAQDLLDSYLSFNRKCLEKDEIPLFDGVLDELQKIKSLGIPQGCVTSKRSESALTTLRLKKLEDFFDIYVFKEATDRHKPCAEPLIFAANKLGITDMSRVIYIGDALPDAQCAANAGADFALVEWSEMDREAVLAAAPAGSRVIRKFSDVLLF